ncbi:hypothetical protein [Spiroplasma floricola]|uniref:Ribose/galactose ABC transporter substrate-binding protein n=1 Tax=Spiroplasma floricola 23-6 TaxID=1336749 RepID=A0A2K8SD95_9MOLU|nr:hypothetical protein [Spiroplasma floricola]AUB31431.1 ribose/galactose ABC transporter substrate-binding protein [Spiroplasma floricola 23-6]
MKKLLSGLMAAAVVASSSSTVIACGSGSKTWNDIYLVTDAGKINDKSFNESGFEAGNKIMEMLKINEAREAEGKSKYDSIGYYQPPTVDDISKGYKNAKKVGAKTLILPGFHHAGDNLDQASKLIKENNGNAIFLDGSPVDSKGQKISNSVGFLFRADISAFYAGMSSIIWSIANDNYNSDNNLILATFGGTPNGLAVQSFMHGYLASIQVYNQLKSEDAGKTTIKNLLRIANSKLTDEEATNKMDAVNVKRANSQSNVNSGSAQTDYFTGTFNAGEGKDISTKLINTDKANVVMGVAGPQTGDLLGVIKANPSQKTMVVGVDSDQVNAYTDSSDKFITSAEKDLVAATIAGAAKTTYLNNTDFGKSAKDYIDKAIINDDQQKEIEANNGSWAGQEIYLNGKFSYSEKNKVNKNLHDAIEAAFNGNNLIEASTHYFTKLASSADWKVTLADAEITKYVNTVLKTN